MTDPAVRDSVKAKVDPQHIQRIATHLQQQLVSGEISRTNVCVCVCVYTN